MSEIEKVILFINTSGLFLCLSKPEGIGWYDYGLIGTSFVLHYIPNESRIIIEKTSRNPNIWKNNRWSVEEFLNATPSRIQKIIKNNILEELKNVTTV